MFICIHTYIISHESLSLSLTGLQNDYPHANQQTKQAWWAQSACFVQNGEIFMLVVILAELKVITYLTKMWNMISSLATPTVCLEQKSENFQSRCRPN